MGTVSPVRAASRPTLQELIALALSANADLQAEQQAYEAARDLVPFYRALPDPMISAQIRNVGFQEITIGREAMAGSGVMFEQKYPNPLKLDLKAQIALQKSVLLKEKLMKSRRLLRQNVKNLYAQQIYYRQALRTDKELQVLLDGIKETLLAYYKVGKVPQKDVWRVQREHSRLAQSQQEWLRRSATAENEFRVLLGWPAPEMFSATDLPAQYPAVVTSVPENWDMQQHPALKIQQQKVKLAQLNYELAESELRPDYVLAGGVTQRGTLDPLWEVRGGMTLPVYAEQKQQLQIQSAQKEREQAGHMLRFETQRLEQIWRNGQVDFKNYTTQLAIVKNRVIPETRSQIDASLAAYLGGADSFESVMQAIADLLRYQRLQLEYELKRLTARHQLDYLAGTTDETY